MVLLCTSQQSEGPFCKHETGELFAELLKENSSLHYRVVRHTGVKEEGGREVGDTVAGGVSGLVDGCIVSWVGVGCIE